MSVGHFCKDCCSLYFHVFLLYIVVSECVNDNVCNLSFFSRKSAKNKCNLSKKMFELYCNDWQIKTTTRMHYLGTYWA